MSSQTSDINKQIVKNVLLSDSNLVVYEEMNIVRI